MKIILFLFVGVLSILRSCNSGRDDSNQPGSDRHLNNSSAFQSVLSWSEYIKWMTNPSNGLLKKKQIGNTCFNLLHENKDYLVSIENEKDLPKDEYEQNKKELGTMDYYDFKISIDGYNDEALKYDLSAVADYSDRINYCSFQMQKDISLIEGNDTLNCTLFHFERTFGAAPYLRFQIAFDNVNQKKEHVFLFNDHLFNNGYIKIAIDPLTETDIPKLKVL